MNLRQSHYFSHKKLKQGPLFIQLRLILEDENIFILFIIEIIYLFVIHQVTLTFLLFLNFFTIIYIES